MNAIVLPFRLIEGRRSERKARRVRDKAQRMNAELLEVMRMLALLQRDRPIAFGILTAAADAMVKEGPRR